jgi:hypothetical protein
MRLEARRRLYQEITGLSAARVERLRTESFGRCRDRGERKVAEVLQSLEGVASLRRLDGARFEGLSRAVLEPLAAHRAGRRGGTAEDALAAGFRAALAGDRAAALLLAPALPMLLGLRG